MLSLIQQLAGHRWAIRGEIAELVRGIVVKDGIAGLRNLAQLKAAIHAFDEDDDEDAGPQAARGRASRASGTVAIVPIIGTMTQRGDVIDSAYTRSTAMIAEEVKAAALDPKVDSIVLEVDSPGGSVMGVTEAWSEIREASKVKPVVASVNSVAASAAYWLACAAAEIVVTPSGEVGSIGVYCVHIDYSKRLEAEGERWTFVSAGKYKVEANPTEPLGEEAHAALQTDVDRYYEMFTSNVARGRGVPVEDVRKGFGQGRMLGARAAVDQRMANSVGTIDDAIRRAAQLARDRRRDSGSSASALEALRDS